MAYSDLYEIKDNQEIAGHAILNIYHATKLNPAFDAEAVLTAFVDTVYPQILAIQPIALQHSTVECRSLDEPLDFDVASPSPNVGVLPGVALSNFVAATIQFNRLRTDMKNGQKRWVAGTESTVTSNLWSAGFLTSLDLLGAALVGNWEDSGVPGVPVCRFIVLKRFCTTTPSPPCVGGYRLPENDAEAAISYIPTSFISRDTVRSQTSRKRLV